MYGNIYYFIICFGFELVIQVYNLDD